MTDTAATQAAPAAASPAVATAADDAALFDKFVQQHDREVAESLGKPRAPTPITRGSDNGRPKEATKSSEPTEPDDEDAHAEDSTTAEADAAGRRDPADAAEPDPAATGSVTEAALVASARAAWETGDKDALDKALKQLLPGSKGLSEFAVDGSRWTALRTVASKRKAAADKRDAELSTREANYQRGLAQMNALVERYSPIEQLVQAAEGDDVDAFVTLIEKVTRKPVNDTVKRHLDKKLNKPVDPHLDAMQRQLKEEREAREALERQLREDKASVENRTRIQNHLHYLDQTLSKHGDARVRELVATPAGMRAIFEAQQQHYDPATGRTISADRAALWVLEQKQKEFEPWQRVLAPRPAPALPAAAPEPKPTARPLGSRGGGASGPGRKLSDVEMFEKYERMAKLG